MSALLLLLRDGGTVMPLQPPTPAPPRAHSATTAPPPPSLQRRTTAGEALRRGSTAADGAARVSIRVIRARLPADCRSGGVACAPVEQNEQCPASRVVREGADVGVREAHGQHGPRQDALRLVCRGRAQEGPVAPSGGAPFELRKATWQLPAAHLELQLAARRRGGAVPESRVRSEHDDITCGRAVGKSAWRSASLQHTRVLPPRIARVSAPDGAPEDVAMNRSPDSGALASAVACNGAKSSSAPVAGPARCRLACDARRRTPATSVGGPTTLPEAASNRSKTSRSPA